jgi:hypothetical protein
MFVRLLVGFCAVGSLVLALTACPVQNQSMPDGGDSDGGDDGSTVNPPLRDVTFAEVPAGDFGGGTLNAVTFQVGPYGGSQVIQVQNLLGEGQDLILECGAVSLHAPELHKSLSLVFNDDNATLLVSVFDQSNQLLTARPIDTRMDAQAVGITRVDAVYKRLDAAIAAGSQQLIGSITIASCQGYLHEIVLH